MRWKTVSSAIAIVFAMIAAALLGTTSAQAAEPTPPPAQVYGGCIGYVCGTVNNHTGTRISVCKNWHGSGQDEHYTDHPCRQSEVAHVKPHSIYGSPQWVDLDALYVPKGKTFYGGYWTYYGVPIWHSMKWTHARSGWWKFATNVVVHIEKVAG